MDRPLEFLENLVKLYKVQHEEYFQMFDNVVDSLEAHTNRDITEAEELHLAGLVSVIGE